MYADQFERIIPCAKIIFNGIGIQCDTEMSMKFPTDILTVRSITTSDTGAVVSASSSLDAEGIRMYSMNQAGLIYSHHSQS